MRPTLCPIFSTVILLLALASVNAQIYTGHDEQGRPYFSDRASNGASVLKLKLTGYAWHTVKQVYDGDTVLLSSNLKVRLLGINTPEIEHRNNLAEPGGNEAKAQLKKWLQNQQVRLEFDVEAKDKYARTLAHLFTRDQQHINLQLVKQGLAVVNLHPPNLKYHQTLLTAQQEAETANLGLWQYPQYQPKNINVLGTESTRGWQRLQGTVSKLRTGRKYSYLEFSEQADLRIAQANLDLFPPLQTYVGKFIEIRGWPSRRKTHYSMLIRHPSAIKILNQPNLP